MAKVAQLWRMQKEIVDLENLSDNVVISNLFAGYFITQTPEFLGTQYSTQIHRLTGEMGCGGVENVLVGESVGGKSLDLMVRGV